MLTDLKEAGGGIMYDGWLGLRREGALCIFLADLFSCIYYFIHE